MVGACCGISMVISLGVALPRVENLPVIEPTIMPILSYRLLSLVFEIISLCGINFSLLFFLVNKISNKKSVIIRFCFISFFIALFCIGKYLDTLGIVKDMPKYIPICMLTHYDVNVNIILSFLITLLLLIDTIILDKHMKQNERE